MANEFFNFPLGPKDNTGADIANTDLRFDLKLIVEKLKEAFGVSKLVFRDYISGSILYLGEAKRQRDTLKALYHDALYRIFVKEDDYNDEQKMSALFGRRIIMPKNSRGLITPLRKFLRTLSIATIDSQVKFIDESLLYLTAWTRLRGSSPLPLTDSYIEKNEEALSEELGIIKAELSEVLSRSFIPLFSSEYFEFSELAMPLRHAGYIVKDRVPAERISEFIAILLTLALNLYREDSAEHITICEVVRAYITAKPRTEVSAEEISIPVSDGESVFTPQALAMITHEFVGVVYSRAKTVGMLAAQELHDILSDIIERRVSDEMAPTNTSGEE